MVQNEEPDGPTECIGVLNQDFKSLVCEALTSVPAYGQWLHETNHQVGLEYTARCCRPSRAAASAAVGMR